MSRSTVTPAAKAVYFIEGDENAYEYQSMVIECEGHKWLVATWIEQIATGERTPDRIVPMEKLPHSVQRTGLIRLGMLMPRELLSRDCSPELLRQYGAETYPGIAHTPGLEPTR